MPATSPPARTAEDLLRAACEGQRSGLARLVSMVEQGGDAAREVARLVFPRGGNTYTVGITGAPGAGKSTLTSCVIAALRGRGQTVAVLAIDPTSPFTGGAILGDRVRMQDHALDEGVFIRSMATRGHLGGLSLAAPEAVRVLDAAGFDWVLLETVGVGQVEVEVAGEADTTVVVVNPGWGDAVQASKAGLLEIADVFVVNKADRPGVDEARRDLEHMLDLAAETATAATATDAWRPPIVPAVAVTGAGLDDVVAAIEAHRSHLEATGMLERRRAERMRAELRAIVTARLEQRVAAAMATPGGRALEQRLAERELDPYAASDAVIEAAESGE